MRSRRLARSRPSRAGAPVAHGVPARSRPASSTRPRFGASEYKTQVFVNHEGDYYRTRLTHTVEAAQVTRTLARMLGLNEDLAETVALAHDLGHTPFGHAGERTLDRLMAASRRLRAQRAEPADRRRARGALSELPRPEPLVGGPRGHRQALDALRSAAGRRVRRRRRRRVSRRRSSTSPTRSPTRRTTSTTACSRACSIPRTCSTVPHVGRRLARSGPAVGERADVASRAIRRFAA